MIDNQWFTWTSSGPHPLTSVQTLGWGVEWPPMSGNRQVVWTGFFGAKDVAAPAWYLRGDEVLPPTSVGARVVGQKVNDHFGAAVGNDGTWLYIAARGRTALEEDVPSLDTDGIPNNEQRARSGVVYQLRIDERTSPGQPNLAQLWIEPGWRQDPNDPNMLVQITWPHVDAQIGSRVDYTMPVPHQYIIESVGSWRGNYGFMDTPLSVAEQDCVDPEQEMEAAGWATSVSSADYAYGYEPYPTATAGYNTDRTPQIVGPHEYARVSFVQGLGDIDDDGIRDFAVGSELIEEPDPNDPDFGNAVGAIYVVSSRNVGLEGDYLLENLHLPPSAPFRLYGLMLKGSSSGETLGRVFDDAGDFNGDGIADVIVGNEAAPSNGEAIVILGSSYLESPEYGWTVNDIVATGNAIRFRGAATGEDAGTNVAGAGDVDGDGYDDVLIAAPGAEGGAGAVYLVYGSPTLSGEIDLGMIGTVDLPGAKFIGRQIGDEVGAGFKLVEDTSPSGSDTTAYSRGVAMLGDIDGDGRGDIAISAMLADPMERQDAGEVYIIYGRGD